MTIASEIIKKYKNVSHREAFVIAKKEYNLSNTDAMIVADDVYDILNPIPITKMEDWKKEIWEKPDFKKLKELISSFDEAEAYFCETNHQMIMVHLKIDDRKSYRDVMDMINKFENFKYRLWDKDSYPIKLKYADELEEYFESIDEETERFFLFANGNTQYLISTCDIRNIEPCL